MTVKIASWLRSQVLWKKAYSRDEYECPHQTSRDDRVTDAEIQGNTEINRIWDEHFRKQLLRGLTGGLTVSLGYAWAMLEKQHHLSSNITKELLYTALIFISGITCIGLRAGFILWQKYESKEANKETIIAENDYTYYTSPFIFERIPRLLDWCSVGCLIIASIYGFTVLLSFPEKKVQPQYHQGLIYVYPVLSNQL